MEVYKSTRKPKQHTRNRRNPNEADGLRLRFRGESNVHLWHRDLKRRTILSSAAKADNANRVFEFERVFDGGALGSGKRNDLLGDGCRCGLGLVAFECLGDIFPKFLIFLGHTVAIDRKRRSRSDRSETRGREWHRLLVNTPGTLTEVPNRLLLLLWNSCIHAGKRKLVVIQLGREIVGAQPRSESRGGQPKRVVSSSGCEWSGSRARSVDPNWGDIGVERSSVRVIKTATPLIGGRRILGQIQIIGCGFIERRGIRAVWRGVSAKMNRIGRGGSWQRGRWAGNGERRLIHVGGRPRGRNFAGIQRTEEGGSIVGVGRFRRMNLIEGRGTRSGEFVESGGTRGKLRFAVARGRGKFLLLDRSGV